jgi:hypothetical protein
MVDYMIRYVDRVEADVECLMCGRVIGQLFGVVLRETPSRRTARTLAHLTTFRDATTGVQPRCVAPFERFRCQRCGGAALVGEVRLSELRETLLENACPVHEEQRTGRGRPPRGCRCPAPRTAA